ncbi:response regulator transcription factor [Promicromonospora sukumoe]|uniref:Two-component system response regulator DesR n=1 Tax=Promicromonospora sukumoe TaxID=88382 RepID=A0A7W3PDI3_9MICO|nr:response regulator transcription factor [Promicromonospora sukumoe]MBA8807823.1 two-component system response regulator DesR [Promicromonospora sukumoe]
MSADRRRVLVVDDHRVVADLIAAAVDAAPDLECVGVADDAPRALALAEATRPDVVLLDVQLPTADGIAVLGQLRLLDPTARVILLTAHPRPDLERAALQAGASGFLAKHGRLSQVLDAVRHASPTRPARDPDLHRHSGAAADRRRLTPRELEVLAMLGDGLDARAIATGLGLSIHTARDHIKALLAKLDARTQLEAVATARREDLIRVGGR